MKAFSVGNVVAILILCQVTALRDVAGQNDTWQDYCGEQCSKLESYIHEGMDGFDVKVFTCVECQQGAAMFPVDGVCRDAVSRAEWTNRCVPLEGEVRKLIMLRHGESEWNAYLEKTGWTGQFTGMYEKWTDSPLSYKGLKQAHRLAEVLRQADIEQPSDPSGSADDQPQTVQAAIEELDTTEPSKFLDIHRKIGDITFFDSTEHWKSIIREYQPEALDVLLGRKCDETQLVSSQLTRAIDTMLIATLPFRTHCQTASWQISSNLQEVEHNADCAARHKPGGEILVAENQAHEYEQAVMSKTLEYVKDAYTHSDITRLTHDFTAMERFRYTNSGTQMDDEAEYLVSHGKPYTIMGGHSIWFREFLKRFGDHGDPLCKQLMSIKMANTGLVSAVLRKAPAAPHGFAVTHCSWVYLGDSKQYEFIVND